MKVTVTIPSVQEALALKEQVQSHGLHNDVDYTWAYTPRREDWMNGVLESATVEFRFVDPHLATFFRLKWAELLN
jgi:hypothetical protein